MLVAWELAGGCPLRPELLGQAIIGGRARPPALGLCRYQARSISRAAERCTPASVVVMCFTISSSASLCRKNPINPEPIKPKT